MPVPPVQKTLEQARVLAIHASFIINIFGDAILGQPALYAITH